MVWFFEREQLVARIETTFDSDLHEYVLAIQPPHDILRTERFTTRETYGARLVELATQLRAQGWVQRGGMEILGDRWRGLTRHSRLTS